MFDSGNSNFSCIESCLTLPVIFLQVLHTDLSDLGSLRTAPYLFMFVSSNFGGWLGDALISRQQYSVVAARRTVNSIGAQLTGLGGEILKRSRFSRNYCHLYTRQQLAGV